MSRDKDKSHLLARARQAEKTTERRIVRSTRNSGRTLKDGDHVHAGLITLDTKLQTGNAHPVVKLDELDKVRADARRAGMIAGGLVLRNCHGRGVVVFDEEDYARLIAAVVRTI